MTKPKRPPTNREFNAAILDKIAAHAMPADQREDEFTSADLAARGMSDTAARRYCVAEWKRNIFSRRIGTSRLTNRRTWIYRVKEAK